MTTGSLFASHLAAYLMFEPFTAVVITVGAVAVARGAAGSGGRWSCWDAATIVGLSIAVVVHAARARQLRHLAVPVVALVLILLDNKLRTGQLQPAAYATVDRGLENGLPYSGCRVSATRSCSA